MEGSCSQQQQSSPTEKKTNALDISVDSSPVVVAYTSQQLQVSADDPGNSVEKLGADVAPRVAVP